MAKTTREDRISQAKAAELCGVSERTMRRWVKSGAIPTVYEAGVRRIRISRLRLDNTQLFETMRDAGL